jgi:hypothetical protein
MKKQLALIFLSFCFVAACKKEKHYADEMAVRFFSGYGMGSYWIYETYSGQLDSTWVEYVGHGFLRSGYSNAGVKHIDECEYHQTNLASFPPDHNRVLKVETNTSAGGGPWTTGGVIDGDPPSGVFYYGCFNNGAIFNDGAGCESRELLNYQVNQYNFPIAVKMVYPPDTSYYVIVAPGVGIVEGRTHSWEQFKLKWYHINP